VGNVAHADEGNPRPKCVHFALAQRDGREGGFAKPFVTFLDTKNPAVNRKFCRNPQR